MNHTNPTAIRFATFFFVVLSLAAMQTVHSAMTQSPSEGEIIIWALHDGEKVEQNDLNHPLKQGNHIWDGDQIRIFGARNEIIAFQIIVEAPVQRIDQLEAKLPELRHQQEDSTIRYRAPDSDPTLYAGRPINLFSVNYMRIDEPSRARWVWIPESKAAPADPTGLKPVQLVPENARAGRGGFPLTVESGHNQSLWFEVYTARNLTAGNYTGEVQLEWKGGSRKIPLTLELFDFTLPDENSMHAMIYYSGSQPELYHGRNLDPAYHRFARRHRVEFVHAYDEARVRSSMGRFDGSDFTSQQGYEGPGEGVGNRIVPATFYGPGDQFHQREKAWQVSNTWMTFLKENLSDAITFVYMPDEPGPDQFPAIRQMAENIHSNPGPGGDLPVLVTHQHTPELEGAIDIWCSGPRGYLIDRAQEIRASGGDYWIYNGGRPSAGAIVIDAPATDARATIWGCFKHDIPVYFYWHGVHWRHNSQKQGNRVQNVWKNSITFDNRGQPNKPVRSQGFIHGDGVLLYPGEDRIHPDQDRGIEGPCSTIQLANFRRGLQDHQYLTMARNLGLEEHIREALQLLVPRMFSEAESTVAFSESGDDFETARYRLAQAIASASEVRR